MVDLTDPRLDNLTVTITDVRANGHCVSGTKEWFESYGLDFRSFLKHGIPARAFLATGDGYAELIVEKILGK